MKKLVLAITIAAMAIGGAAIADDYNNNVGVYFDEAATTVCVSDVILNPATSPVYEVYVILNKATEATVKGFELKLTSEGPLMLLGFTFPDPLAVNVGDEPAFIVGFPEAHPIMNRSFELMRFSVLVTSKNPALWLADGNAYVYLSELDFPSLSVPLPAYLTGAEDLIAMHQATGTENNPAQIYVLEGDCPTVVATDNTSWDGLKSLYR